MLHNHTDHISNQMIVMSESTTFFHFLMCTKTTVGFSQFDARNQMKTFSAIPLSTFKRILKINK
jgi:hypothetical protein